MENTRTAFALKLILGSPFVGILWTCIIYFLFDSGQLNFNIAYWVGGIGIIVGVICFISDAIFKNLWWLWKKIIFIVDFLIVWLTLPFFYFLIFTPFSILLRKLGKANMKHPNKNIKSYWRVVEQPEFKEQYLRRF